MTYTNTKKTATFFILAACLIVFWGCSQYQTRPAVPATTTAVPTAPVGKIVPKDITIANFQFSPENTELTIGETAQWINNDNVPHTIVADDNSFQSPSLQAGESFIFTFTQTGTVGYHCSIHPSMKGTITTK